MKKLLGITIQNWVKKLKEFYRLTKFLFSGPLNNFLRRKQCTIMLQHGDHCVSETSA